jgi:hypothetical protein
MSRGAGAVERKIVDIWIASDIPVYTAGALVWRVFGLEPGTKASRAQRISVLRAARRVLKRVEEQNHRHHQAWDDAESKAEAGLGRKRAARGYDAAFQKAIERHLDADSRSKGKTHPAAGWREGKRDGQVVFHYVTTPLEVWAIKIQPAGVAWAKAEIIRITERFVLVRYRGEIARLHRRRLTQSFQRLDGEHYHKRVFGFAWWRGVLFTSSRSGQAAAFFDELWWERYGSAQGATPKEHMPLAEARALLGLPRNYTRADIIRAFRKAAFKAHPDVSGSAELFRRVVEARDRLLAALGMKAREVHMPEFAPKGVRLVYRSRPRRQHLSRPSTLRIGRGP